MRYELARKDLIEMLTTKRPAGGYTEDIFMEKWLEPLGGKYDECGNYMCEVPNPDGSPSDVMWSSHTDTVHWTDGRQTLHIDGNDIIHLSKNSKKGGECLGADCTTGVWLMREMYFANIPGLYVWHFGEEQGCIGSKWILANTPELLKDIKYCVAFDRYGTDSVITHQSMTRTASDVFGKSWSTATDMEFKLDPGGSYTDSYTYQEIIPECTNISVGYYGQHGPGEVQCLTTAMLLLEAMCNIDLTKLVCERDPEAREDQWAAYRYGTFEDKPWPMAQSGTTYDQLLEFVQNNPHEAADLLETLGANVHDINDQLGYLPTMIREYKV